MLSSTDKTPDSAKWTYLRELLVESPNVGFGIRLVSTPGSANSFDMRLSLNHGVGLAIALAMSSVFSEPVEILKITARTSSGRETLLQEVSVFRADNAVLYRLPIMAIDLDGAPNAYHPPTPGHPHGKGPGLGLEDLRNASKNLDDGPNAVWVGIVTDVNGRPVIQKEGMFSGFYVSKTSLEDTRFAREDQRRYIDATKIPYVVLNPIVRQKAGIDVGDLAVIVLSPANPKVAYGIVADIGPRRGLGECSKALAASIGIPLGIEQADILYIFFPTPGRRKARSAVQIRAETETLFAAWGGIARIQTLRQGH